MWGLAYDIVKDIYRVIKEQNKPQKWTEDKKPIDEKWMELSGYRASLEKAGMKEGWARPERIETWLLKGWNISYLFDEENNVKYRLVKRGGVTLLVKPK